MSRRTLLKLSTLTPLLASGCARLITELDAMRTRVRNDIQGWDAIVDHRTGTDGDELTAEWLSSELRQAGAEPTVVWFDFRRRVLHDCYVEV
jgi:hypothetical protein